MALRIFRNLADLYCMANPYERTHNLLIFHLSGLVCAFPLEDVMEVVPMARLSAPPGLPPALAGFLDLRGTAIPILRLDRLFGLAEQQPGLHTPMIVLRGLLGPMGLIVDSVRGVVPMPAAILDIPDDRTFQGCATAVVKLEGDLVHLLSPASLLSANEAHLIADFSAMAQARVLQLETGN
jgi:purine-binding chemotaxis protein CheW